MQIKDRYSVTINGKPVLRDGLFTESVLSVERISFCTGFYRLNPARNLDPETVHIDLSHPDDPGNAATYYIDEVIRK